MTDEILREVCKELKAMCLHEVAEVGNDYLFIVAGSIWSNRVNTAYLLDWQGNVIIEQKKLSPYRDEEDRKENIQIDDPRVVNILDVPGFGRLNLFICVDFLLDQFDSLTREIGVNIFLGTLFSSSLRRFHTNSQRHGGHNFALVCTANACCGIGGGKPICFHYIASKLKEEDGEGSELSAEKYNVKGGVCETCLCHTGNNFCYILTEIGKDSVKRYRIKK